MGKREFITARRARWEETEQLLRRIRGRGIKSLDIDELMRLGTLYRQAASDLARARAVEPFGDVTLYLNRLVSNTHAVIYSSEARPWTSFINYITFDFPSMVRKHSNVILLATLFLMLPGVLGYYWMQTEPRWMKKYFPDINYIVNLVEGGLAEGPSQLASGNITRDMMPLASSAIMTNNIRVTILTFASGITFGLLTAFLLIRNGILLGGVAWLYFARPFEYNFYFLAGILPHGVIEIPAIIFSGAAGFLIARALIVPGNLRRIDSLRYHGHDAIRIMYGVVIMLVIAAFIEAFITPFKLEGSQNLVDWTKIVFSVVVGILMIFYFVYAGRHKESI